MIERQNYLKTKKHLEYLHDVLQLNPASLERYWFYLRHLLLWADATNLNQAAEIRPTFPTYLISLPGKDGKATLAPDTLKKILNTSKRFFRWAKSEYAREFTTLSTSWIDTLRLPRQPQVKNENVFVSVGEVKQLLAYPAAENDLALQRDQAAAALLFLSGMCGNAFVTLPISALDLEHLSVRQWPELGVHTKNSKRATTFLLNIPELLDPIRRWDTIVRPALSPSTPWYAPIDHRWGEQYLSKDEPGKNRRNALEKRLKLLYRLAKADFKSPHKFRHGHAVFGLLHAQTMADYKAVSMNLMHDSIEITDSTYAPMLTSDVQVRIAGLAGKAPAKPDGELETYLSSLSKESLGKALVIIADKLTR